MNRENIQFKILERKKFWNVVPCCWIKNIWHVSNLCNKACNAYISWLSIQSQTSEKNL